MPPPPAEAASEATPIGRASLSRTFVQNVLFF